MITIGSSRHEGDASTPSATRAARPTWTGSTTTASGFNYRLSDVACAIGLAQMDRLERHARRPRPRRGLVPRGARRRWRPSAASGCPCEDGATIAGDRRGWFVFVVQVPHDGPSRDDVIRALRERGVQSKPYLPAVHLMSYYREHLRLPRGPVPGLRGHRRPLAGAAVLPGDHAGAGRPRLGATLADSVASASRRSRVLATPCAHHWAAWPPGTRRQQEIAARRRARRTGAVGFVVAAALPVVLWRRRHRRDRLGVPPRRALPRRGLVAVGADGARPDLPARRPASSTGATATAASTARPARPGPAGASRSTCWASRWRRRSPRSPTRSAARERARP